MGRAVGQILLVSAAIAVNFIPGVGQAISGTLVGALGSAGATIATGLTTALSVAGIQSAAGLLGPWNPETRGHLNGHQDASTGAGQRLR